MNDDEMRKEFEKVRQGTAFVVLVYSVLNWVLFVGMVWVLVTQFHIKASVLPTNISEAVGQADDVLFTSADYAQATDWGVPVIETANEQVFVYLFGDGAVSTIKDGGWQQADYLGYVPPVEPVPVETPEASDMMPLVVMLLVISILLNRKGRQ